MLPTVHARKAHKVGESKFIKFVKQILGTAVYLAFILGKETIMLVSTASGTM